MRFSYQNLLLNNWVVEPGPCCNGWPIITGTWLYEKQNNCQTDDFLNKNSMLLSSFLTKFVFVWLQQAAVLFWLDSDCYHFGVVFPYREMGQPQIWTMNIDWEGNVLHLWRKEAKRPFHRLVFPPGSIFMNYILLLWMAVMFYLSSRPQVVVSQRRDGNKPAHDYLSVLY